MKIGRLLLLLLVVLMIVGRMAARAAEVDVGKAFPKMELTDQHEKSAKAPGGVRYVVIGFEMPVAKKLNKWLDGKGKDYLPKHKALWIADVTPMPKVIASTFAIPKMRKYAQRIFLVREDGFGEKFPQKKKHATVFELDAGGTIKAVSYVADGDDLGAMLEGK